MQVRCPVCKSKITEIQEVPLYNKDGIRFVIDGKVSAGSGMMDIVSVCRCSCGNEFVVDEVDIEVK